MDNELRIFKDAVDAGYKVNGERFSELGKLNLDARNATILSLLVPIFNIMQVFQRTIQYNNVRLTLLDQLSVLDVLEEMSEMEKAEYLKNPTGLNALSIASKSEKRLSKSIPLIINDGNEHSEIYYEMGESLNDITILKVSGSASRLTLEEQKEKVIKAVMKKYGIAETHIEDSKEAKKDEENTSLTAQVFSISESKQALESLKSELLEEQEVSQSVQTDKGAKLSKRKK